MIKKFTLKDSVLFFLFVLPVVVYFVVLLRFSVNIPFWDDFDTFFSFLVRYFDFKTLSDKLWLIFSQHAEHRFAFNRIVVLANYYLGGINFITLILIGNLALVVLLAMIFKSSKLDKNKLLIFLPVPFLMFQPQYSESMFWATAALCNFYILLFSFVAVFCFSKPSRAYFYLGIIFSFLATFTMGNGLFVFFVGLLMLLYQRRYFDSIILAFVCVVVSMFYFRGYIKSIDHPGLMQALSHPFRTLEYFFLLLGAPVGFLKMKLLALVSGVVVSLYFLYLTWKLYFKKNLVIYSFFLFLLITAVTVSIARSVFGIERAFASKYAVFSILFYVLGYISFVELFPFARVKKFVIGFVLIACCFNVLSYYSNISDIKSHRESVKNGLVYPDPIRAESLLRVASDRGIYTLSSVGD